MKFKAHFDARPQGLSSRSHAGFLPASAFGPVHVYPLKCLTFDSLPQDCETYCSVGLPIVRSRRMCAEDDKEESFSLHSEPEMFEDALVS